MIGDEPRDTDSDPDASEKAASEGEGRAGLPFLPQRPSALSQAYDSAVARADPADVRRGPPRGLRSRRRGVARDDVFSSEAAKAIAFSADNRSAACSGTTPAPHE